MPAVFGPYKGHYTRRGSVVQSDAPGDQLQHKQRAGKDDGESAREFEEVEEVHHGDCPTV